MTLPLRSFQKSSQNSRVDVLTTKIEEDNSSVARDLLINKCYRQIFFHLTDRDREKCLESQFKSQSITVRDFIRGLFLSERFRKGYIECNNNYRLVEQVIFRALGRKIYNDTERLSYSILIAEKGFTSFIDCVLDSEEYMMKFGYDNPPNEYSRILPGKESGTIPLYQQYPRYGLDWQKKLTSNKLMMSISDHLLYSKKSTIEKFIYDKPTGTSLKIWITALVLTGAGTIWLSILIFKSAFQVN